MINTLWYTGASISECLLLPSAGFTQYSAHPYLLIHTLKLCGQLKISGLCKLHSVLIVDEHYSRQYQGYLRSHQDRLVVRLAHKPCIHIPQIPFHMALQ